MIPNSVAAKRCRDWLELLIRCPSENPPGDESAIAVAVAGRLKALGVEVELIGKADRRPNVVARLDSGRPGPRLLWQAHLDTKPASGSRSEEKAWHSDPFQPMWRKGRVYGLGAADTKGGAAAQLAAVEWFRANGDWSGELVWLGCADEEAGSEFGAAYLLGLGLLEGTAACVAEPTSLAVSTAQLGNAWMEIEVLGRPAHAGRPREGNDAVEAAESLWNAIRGRLEHSPTDDRFPDHPRLNIGRIAGGTHQGSVPGFCNAKIDIRVLPEQDRESLYQLVDDAATEVERERGVTIRTKPVDGGGCESHSVPILEPWSQALSAARIVVVPEIEESSHGFAGGTDARFFAKAGTPAVVFGPGDLAQAHAPNEFVPFGEVVLAARILSGAAGSFLRPTG